MVLLGLLLTAAAGAAGRTIETVSVSILADTAPPPDRIAKRMAASVITIGEQVLIGRPVDEVAAKSGSYEKLVREVFDRILVGYSVDEVEISPGVDTHISLKVSPWGEVVREVKVDIDYRGIAPAIVPLINQDLGNLADKVSDLLVGLPIDAVDWAGGVSRTVIREIFANQLPEYLANMDIVSGPQTTVKLSFVPRGAVIQDTHVTLKSRTIPNILLLQARPALEKMTKSLNGLPVAFVDRHRDFFPAQLAAIAEQHSIARRYGLTLTPIVNAGTDTEVIVEAETTKFKVTLEGYLDMGRKTDNTSVRLHVGKIMGSRDELFLETEFISNNVTWNFMPGWGHRLGASTVAGVKYSTEAGHNIFWLNQEIGKRWALRLERTQGTGYDELGLRYKLHDFLSAEYVFSDHEKWLRLVGNL